MLLLLDKLLLATNPLRRVLVLEVPLQPNKMLPKITTQQWPIQAMDTTWAILGSIHGLMLKGGVDMPSKILFGVHL